MLNQRNWIDVAFVTPPTTASASTSARSSTCAPEFMLGGAGLGTLALDTARAPMLLPAGTARADFRYWLTGVRGTGAITLTYLAGTWSFNSTALDRLDRERRHGRAR